MDVAAGLLLLEARLVEPTSMLFELEPSFCYWTCDESSFSVAAWKLK